MDFSWIIIILVIFGMISSVVKRMKNSAPPPEQRPQPTVLKGNTRMQRYHESSEQRPLLTPAELGDRTDFGDELSKSDHTPEEDLTDYGDIEGDILSTEDEVLDETNNRVSYSSEGNTLYQRETVLPYKRKTLKSYRESRKKGSNYSFKHLTKEQLREGILLSEVLQPPRAKRPHPAAQRPYHHIKS